VYLYESEAGFREDGGRNDGKVKEGGGRGVVMKQKIVDQLHCPLTKKARE